MSFGRNGQAYRSTNKSLVCFNFIFFFAIQKVYKKKATNKQTKRNLHDDDDDEYAGGNFNGEEKM